MNKHTINSDKFAKQWKMEKNAFLRECTNEESGSDFAQHISAMHLSDEQKNHFDVAMNSLLTDVFYTLLLGLDGSAAIGDKQQTYKIYDEDNNLISDCGDLEASAYRYFYE